MRERGGCRGKRGYPCFRGNTDPCYIHVVVQQIELGLQGQNETADKREREERGRQSERLIEGEKRVREREGGSNRAHKSHSYTHTHTDTYTS